MDMLDITLIFSITLCSLVSGFILTYSIVVMPGLSNLNDKDFLKAFQVTDAIIQNNQPVFMFIWIGSILAVLATILVSLVSIGFAEAWLIVLVAFVYLLGVQGITVAIHIPLNNHIQRIKIEDLNDEALADQRLKFETKWTFFNYIRTSIAISVSVLLLILLGNTID
ncbi:MAG: hypothetical protein CM15mP117_20220 [Alphaproteobacteria bacterium]|nr:MAG: hypothetical protein CM15mP117_20220 [Alphaproteobacteria bacterium]